MKDLKILVLGDIAIDFNMQTSTYPPEGGAAHASQADMRLGGSGCLTALTLSGLGLPTALAGNLGSDMFAEFIMQKIRSGGLDSSLVRRLPDEQSGFFLIAATPSGKHTTFGNRGANAQPLPLEDITARLSEFKHLHISGYILIDEEQFQVTRRILLRAKQLGLTTSLDPGVCYAPEAQEKVRSLLQYIDVFLPNRDETARLGGPGELNDQLAVLLELGCGAVIVKLGKEGCRYYDRHQWLDQAADPIPQEEIKDITGAGDSFNGGFLSGILAGETPAKALRMGNRAARRIITSPHGILDLIPT
ncbi:carbohydrate kinase family protein [Pelolinea submarina]|uniref:Ribokinase n=1 Tax=Pelolinea submarina TaxID=913107 RepID=A0A347ZNJ6_9CHLR|nr:carbohydrate kinase family protein [Pelolinea submarina]REG08480.1 ribokinase [Pelolinea submarina]BBB46877.1 ribokinase [Pelolinea submarina]